MCNCNKPKICQETNSCACEVFLTSDCINNIKSVFECLDIATGLTLTETLEAMDAQICIKFDTITNYFTIINVGTGEQLYKGVNNLGQKEFRTIVKEGNLVTVEQDTDTIIIGIDETALTAYVQTNQKTTVVSNAGDGAPLVKTAEVSGDETTYPIKSLKYSAQDGEGESLILDLQQNTDDITIRGKKAVSNTITITSTDEEVRFELVESSDIPRFIVNSSYTGIEELGTLTKPFKTIQAAKDAYIGDGDAQTPDTTGGEIIIQKGNGYTFTGDIVINGVTIILEENTLVISNPASGDWLCDFDTLTDTDTATLNIILKKGAIIELLKSGFRNRGTSINTGSFTTSKAIDISGEGIILQSITDEININYTILESNFTTGNTFQNDSNSTFNISGIEIFPLTQQIAKIGGNSVLIMDNVSFKSGSSLQSVNTGLKLFELIGGQLRLTNFKIGVLNNARETVFSLTKNSGISCSIVGADGLVSGTALSLFKNENTNQSSVNIKSIKSQFDTFTKLATSPNVLWTNFAAFGCIFNTGTIEDSEIDLTLGNSISTSNIFASRLLESLQTFSSRADAVSSGGLKKGNSFINRKPIVAGAFVIGVEYKILTIGTTDYTLIGAASNTVGLYFTATGVGTGTGTAYSYTVDTLI